MLLHPAVPERAAERQTPPRGQAAAGGQGPALRSELQVQARGLAEALNPVPRSRAPAAVAAACPVATPERWYAWDHRYRWYRRAAAVTAAVAATAATWEQQRRRRAPRCRAPAAAAGETAATQARRRAWDRQYRRYRLAAAAAARERQLQRLQRRAPRRHAPAAAGHKQGKGRGSIRTVGMGHS